MLDGGTNPGVDDAKLGLSPRLVAAGWFALCACIPVVSFLAVFGLLPGFGKGVGGSPSHSEDLAATLCLFGGLPVSIAAFFGFTLGVRILDPRLVRRSRKALAYGLLVAVVSYCVFIFTYSIRAGTSNVNDSSPNPVQLFFTLFFLGAVLVGWLIVIAGVLGGWLLFKLAQSSLFSPRLLEVRRVSVKTARHLNLAAMAFFIVLCSTFWLVLHADAKRRNFERLKIDVSAAARSGRTAEVESILSTGVSVETQDVGGSTLLLLAAQSGNTRLVEILLAHGANPNVSDDRHMTPLLWAVKNADLESIKVLVAHGTKVDVADATGRTPLMEAAWATNKDIVMLLIEKGADVNSRADDGQTAWSLATARRKELGRLDIDRTPLVPGKGRAQLLEGLAAEERARRRHDEIISLLKSRGAV